MAKDYRILKVSTQEPKEYTGQYGTVYYINVMLEGHPKTVSIGKKRPDALKAGDTVYGTITETQYDTDKFKLEKKDGGNFSKGKSQMDSTTMYVSYAKDILVAMIDTKKPFTMEDFQDYIKHVASQGKVLKELVEAKPTLSENWQKTQALKDDRDNGLPDKNDGMPPLEAYEGVTEEEMEEPINLDDIPFN